MERLKTFLLYALIIAAFWLVSDIIIYLCIHATYQDVDTKVYDTSSEITINESKATYVNGYVKGSIKNTSQDIIKEKYIEIDLYSQKNIKLGTKYIKIENLDSNSCKEFEMWYKYTDVNYVMITTTDTLKDVTQEEFVSEKMANYLIVGALLSLYFI